MSKTHPTPNAAVRRGVFAGSFDPITHGHVDVLRAALAICDELVVAVGHNPQKTPLLPLDTRLSLLAAIAGDLGAGARVRAASFSGLLVDFARREGATLILRGIRDAGDLPYEMQMAGMNGAMAGDIQTVLIPAKPQHRHITATLVRQIATMGGDVSPFVPEPVRVALKTDASDA